MRTLLRGALNILGFAGAMSSILNIMAVFYLSYQHDFRVTIGTNTYGEFWVESFLLIATSGAFLYSYFGLLKRLAKAQNAPLITNDAEVRP